jgi:hypothetical protein
MNSTPLKVKSCCQASPAAREGVSTPHNSVEHEKEDLIFWSGNSKTLEKQLEHRNPMDTARTTHPQRNLTEPRRPFLFYLKSPFQKFAWNSKNSNLQSNSRPASLTMCKFNCHVTDFESLVNSLFRHLGRGREDAALSLEHRKDVDDGSSFIVVGMKFLLVNPLATIFSSSCELLLFTAIETPTPLNP